MSETVHHKGTLTLIKIPQQLSKEELRDFTWKETIEYLQEQGYKIKITDPDDETFESTDCVFANGKWYYINDETLDADADICEAIRIDESTIRYDLRWYNGSASMGEMLDKAVEYLEEADYLNECGI